jgi:hypothetical protein
MYFLVRGESTMWRKAEASKGTMSGGPSPSACRSIKMPPVFAIKLISSSTGKTVSCLGRSYETKNEGLQISSRVSRHIGLNGSSGCSATAMSARITESERGTFPCPAPLWPDPRSDPISMIVRTSFRTCSFSTACLVSRASDLKRV